LASIFEDCVGGNATDQFASIYKSSSYIYFEVFQDKSCSKPGWTDSYAIDFGRCITTSPFSSTMITLSSDKSLILTEFMGNDCFDRPFATTLKASQVNTGACVGVGGVFIKAQTVNFNLATAISKTTPRPTARPTPKPTLKPSAGLATSVGFSDGNCQKPGSFLSFPSTACGAEFGFPPNECYSVRSSRIPNLNTALSTCISDPLTYANDLFKGVTFLQLRFFKDVKCATLAHVVTFAFENDKCSTIAGDLSAKITQFKNNTFAFSPFDGPTCEAAAMDAWMITGKQINSGACVITPNKAYATFYSNIKFS